MNGAPPSRFAALHRKARCIPFWDNPKWVNILPQKLARLVTDGPTIQSDIVLAAVAAGEAGAESEKTENLSTGGRRGAFSASGGRQAGYRAGAVARSQSQHSEVAACIARGGKPWAAITLFGTVAQCRAPDSNRVGAGANPAGGDGRNCGMRRRQGLGLRGAQALNDVKPWYGALSLVAIHGIRGDTSAAALVLW